jgi:glycine/D-amino acid oxidase-like deaminating enzyme
MQRIAVIGAGMAGLACARRLADAGRSPAVFDKGRGIGGRLATRREAAGLQFDHGAQYVTARGEGFGSVLRRMQDAGAAAPWANGSGRPHVVGTPGMTALAKHLGRGLDLHLGTEVSGLRREDGAWTLQVGGEPRRFDRVVLTAPAPQAAALLGADHPLADALAQVRLDPCLTLMAAMDPAAPRPFVTRADADDPLAWIAHDSSKPGRVERGAPRARSRGDRRADAADAVRPARRGRERRDACRGPPLAPCKGGGAARTSLPARCDGQPSRGGRLVPRGAGRGRVDQRRRDRARHPGRLVSLYTRSRWISEPHRP